jgi:hypothetical protein
MHDLKEVKSILAKLLANENISVSHQNVKCSYFSIKDRVLICPIWKEMDGNLYDLFLGHEIGHALFTPQKGWHDVPYVSKDGALMPQEFKDILNVLEDARIEKKMKRKYPGLSKSFFLAYKKLHSDDFFGISNLTDLSQLNIVDKINVHKKIGINVEVPFTEADIVILQEVDDLETWEDVEELAWKLYLIEEISVTDEELNESVEEAGNQDQPNDIEEFIEESVAVDSDDNEDSDEHLLELIFNDDATEALQQNLNEELLVDNELDLVDSEEAEELHTNIIKISEIGSITDRAFRENEKQLVDLEKQVYIFTLPEENLNNIILDNDTVIGDLENFIKSQLEETANYENVLQHCVKKFNNKNKKLIYNILKEFNMRKAAVEYSKTFTTKSGELEMNQLYKYKFTHNLFKKREIVMKGKSHGIIIFIDFSSSMQTVLRNTVEQMLVLIAFCKLAQIPFDVYAFSNGNYRNKKLQQINQAQKFKTDDSNLLQIPAYGFHLKHLISSKMKSSSYKRCFKILCVLANEYNSNDDEQHLNFQKDWTGGGISLHGTPFVETLLSSRTIIDQFKKQHKVDITNVIYLTDGEGYPNSITYPPHVDPMRDTIYLVDKKSKEKIKLTNILNSEQECITQLISNITSCKHIGFYICNLMQMKDMIAELRTDTSNLTKIDLSIAEKTVKHDGFMAIPRIGYYKYFYIRSSIYGIKEDYLEVTDTNLESLTAEFNRFQKNKRNNRILISKIAEEISKGL